MALTLECPNCGCNEFSSFLFRNNGYICKCCGQYTYEKKGLGEDEVLKLSRCDGAYREIRSYRFSEAKRLFEDILRDYPDCVEAHWGLIQARYGIVYVKGFYTGEITPIYCFPDYNNDNIEYITDQPEYEALMELLADDDERRALYIKKSQELDEALDIFADSKEEEPIDVFLCVKISKALPKCPELTEKTELDLPKAQELREKLTARGKKVFFSYKNLTNNLESDMDIWKSLVKSRKMLLITSSRDYLESVWVRSEWERWLSLGGDQQNNLYIYLLGDAKKLSRRLPPELKGRQFYTEETQEKLIADLCFDPEADRIAKEKAEKEAEEKQKEDLQKQFEEMMRKRLEEIEKTNREKQDILLRKIEELEKKVAHLEEKTAKDKDDYIRLMAEFDNFRRRTAQEKLELVSMASTETIKGLLPILDDCERALKVLLESNDSDAAKEGTELIFSKLMGYLKGKGLAVIEAIDQPFDTDLHEAVAQFPVQEEDKKGKIFDVVQTGYTLNGKVIRFAKVVVGI